MRLTPILLSLAIIVAFHVRAGESTSKVAHAFDFGAGRVAPGFVEVEPSTSYSRESGYGFEPGAGNLTVESNAEDPLRGDFITSARPFYFSVAVPEGNYRVTLHMAGGRNGSTITVKAELRRLMLEKVHVPAGQIETRTFVVNVRTPRLPGGGDVRLKERERTMEWWAWDEKLTLEFNGESPAIAGIQIERVENIPTVYLLGDSTVCDQPREPWNSWGQMLTRFFKPTVAVANHAESGESWRSSIGARRVEKVYSLLKRGDYVFAQFGHNDMKSTDPNALAIYASDLSGFISKVRDLGATPVLVTSMERKAGVENDTLGEYPETVRRVARERDVVCVDLHAMSKLLYRALGSDLDEAFQDGTHHNNYGSYQLAKCVVESIRRSRLDLATHIVEEFLGFNPAEPDPAGSFEIPPSPVVSDERPPGD